MANTVKPNTFPTKSLPLDGNEELYTQSGGVNNKFTVQNIWDGVQQVTTIIPTGDTIINNQTIIFTGTTNTVLVSGGTTIVPSGSTIISGSTSEVTDNGDGTYTHHDGVSVLNDVTIKPVDYFTSERQTGERWIDGKVVYRRVVQLSQWTVIGDLSGSYTLGTGQTFEHVTRLDFFYVVVDGAQRAVINLNTGDKSSWQGGANLIYDGVNSNLTWDNMGTLDTILSKPTPYVILEYTKP